MFCKVKSLVDSLTGYPLCTPAAVSARDLHCMLPGLTSMIIQGHLQTDIESLPASLQEYCHRLPGVQAQIVACKQHFSSPYFHPG